MKYPLFFFILALSRAIAAADDPPSLEPKDTNIFIEMQMVTLPREIAIPLVRDLADPAKIEGAVAQLQQMLEKGTAKLVGWPMLTMHSGQRSVIEAIDEFRYASEYEPAAVDVYLTQGPGKEGAVKQELPEIAARELVATPTAFETRNTGVTLEVEPMISADGKHLELNLVPQHVRLVRMSQITVELEKSHEKVLVEQPEFDTMKTTTQLTLKSGEHVLLGVYPAPEPPDTLELFILRAEIRKVQ